MTSYCLFPNDLNEASNGSYSHCVALGRELPARGDQELPNIARVRPGEQETRFPLEMTTELAMQAAHRRTESCQQLRRLTKCSQLR